MELILANKNLNDIRRIFDYEIDVDLGDNNTFELKISRSDILMILHLEMLYIQKELSMEV